MKTLTLSFILLSSLGASVQAANAPFFVAAGQAGMGDVVRRVESTQWQWHNADDYVQAGGVTVIKDGAWQVVRLRTGGRLTAWHGEKIVHECRWEPVDPQTIRIHAGPREGLVVRFDQTFSNCTVTNERATTGKLAGRAPGEDLLVGRWKWNGPGVVRFREDGKAFQEWPYGKQGRWRAIGRERYEVVWDGGTWTDTMRMKSGNNNLTGKNQKGKELHAARVGTDGK